MSLSKESIRKNVRAWRKTISLEQREIAANAATRIFLNDPLFIQKQNYGIYLPHDGEFDSEPLIQALWLAEKKCYLPTLTTDNQLVFHLYTPESSLKKNQYSILEVPFSQDVTLPAKELDVVFTPLVAFDSVGIRLGMGGGYYDRTFQFLEKKRGQPLLIGLGYQAQQVDVLPRADWDIPLDAVLTEEKITTFI